MVLRKQRSSRIRQPINDEVSGDEKKSCIDGEQRSPVGVHSNSRRFDAAVRDVRSVMRFFLW